MIRTCSLKVGVMIMNVETVDEFTEVQLLRCLESHRRLGDGVQGGAS